MIPFYIYYSMFGFQRIGDFAWAAGDMQARGFLIGGTAGRTTLAGEGLQHQDGHSQLLATTIPNCVAYDPTFAYELAVIVQDGLRRMYVEQEKIFYYITCMNENYTQPALPEGVREGILKGHVPAAAEAARARCGRNLLGSGTILREVIKAAELLEQDYGVAADVFSAPSFPRTATRGARCGALESPPSRAAGARALRRQLLDGHEGPFIAATDYMRIVPDQIRQWIPGTYHVLGTDGYGRSDSRAALRHFFEVDHRYIVVAALKLLVDAGKLDRGTVTSAIAKFGIDPEKPNPVTV